MDRKSVDSSNRMNQVDPVIDASMKGEKRVGPLPSLYLLDSLKAHLPEFSAYAAYFAGRYQVKRIPLSELSGQLDLRRSIVWQFMGLAWSSVPAGCVVHDYRSLSTGRLSRLKDWLKKKVNVKPDVRVFLNAMVRDEMGFEDGVPDVILDMGVPDWISEYSGIPESFDWEYCYVGAISRDAGCLSVQ
ncbi:MAG: hypothetical protein BWY82_01085 [Verrucomicrobia bacterium ADurb.Bin474]|nr:MAG: hypothetical protein BWY82_01085 [Verrucomicrobia bacterium ADurb.Bin474]